MTDKEKQGIAKFKKELKALANKYNLRLLDECAFCGHGKECTDKDTCYYFTVFNTNDNSDRTIK